MFACCGIHKKMVLNVYIRAFWHLQFISLIFRFDRSDYENGYSRNLLWRLWHAAKLFRIRHLFQLCSEVGYLSMSLQSGIKEIRPVEISPKYFILP